MRARERERAGEGAPPPPGWTINKVTLAKTATGRWAEIDFEVELQKPMDQWSERAQLDVVPDPNTKCADPRRQWRGLRRRQLAYIGERLIDALGFMRRHDDGAEDTRERRKKQDRDDAATRTHGTAATSNH